MAQSGTNYCIYVKSENGSQMVEITNITVVNSSSSDEILYVDADDFSFSAKGNAELYIHNLPVGDYKAWYTIE